MKTGSRESAAAAAGLGRLLCVSLGQRAREGAEEGLKNRPCAIVAARQVVDGKEVVTVVPVTHTPPANPADAVELPPELKKHLGLDAQRSWIVVTEVNDFLWPGPDLQYVAKSKPPRFHYGMLPPRFYHHVRERILQAHLHRRLNRIPRTE